MGPREYRVKVSLVVGEQTIDVGVIRTAGDEEGYRDILARMVDDVAKDIEHDGIEVYPYNNWDK